MVSGIVGTCLGTMLSRLFRNKVPYVDPLICALGLLMSAPLTILSIFVVMKSIPAAYVRNKPLSFLSTQLKQHFYYWPKGYLCWSVSQPFC